MALNPVDSFAVDHPGGGERNVQLLWGDLTQMAPEQAVEVLVVSALPGDYTPTPGSLLAALAQAGVSVAQLSQNKAHSWEPLMPCWISQPIHSATVRCQRILVYEPASPAQNAAANAWMIFQALACFYGAQATTVAMPLVCTGSGGAEAKPVLEALSWAGAHYGGSNTAPMISARVVAYTQALAAQLAPAFAQIKAGYGNVFKLPLPNDYGLYVSEAEQRIAQQPPPPSVTTRQAIAVCIYSSQYYTVINATLRNHSPNDPAYQLMHPLFEAIDTGLANMVAHPGTSYRADNMSPQRESEYQPGAIITNVAYTSSSLRPDAWQGRDHLVIAGRDGREVWAYSLYPHEQEVLFARLFTLRVNTRNCNSSQCTFGVTELVTDWCGGGQHA